ncbi:TadE family type IV pilus minor pilin [Parafrigoribacterium soli]|uniref:TadE family type IV pilus minor pilin n=1 Tax=Parafrigoribacterium soli TaxID=3144663 RepID=UPI0032EE265F
MSGDRGSVTAEFATVIPAVLLVLACCLGAVQLAGTQLRLQDAAAAAARSIARGDSAAVAAARAAQLVAGATLTRIDRGGMTCVRLRSRGPAGPFAAIAVTASSCALAAGE